jgi:hypothetical protein
MTQGHYADRRTYDLPNGWAKLPPTVLDSALDQARMALDLLPSSRPSAQERLSSYYAIEGNFAGATFLDAQPQDDYDITAADLWAVTTLSIDVPPLTGRRLLLAGNTRSTTHQLLRQLEPNRPITDLAPGMLDTMWTLYDTFRTVMATEDKRSNWWVFAAKLCARKRPDLFPVRDNLVCNYLAAGRGLGKKPGQLGKFSADLQVFAYLMTSSDISQRLLELYECLRGDPDVQVDVHMMRLLDAALWTAARAGTSSY